MSDWLIWLALRGGSPDQSAAAADRPAARRGSGALVARVTSRGTQARRQVGAMRRTYHMIMTFPIGFGAGTFDWKLVAVSLHTATGVLVHNWFYGTFQLCKHLSESVGISFLLGRWWFLTILEHKQENESFITILLLYPHVHTYSQWWVERASKSWVQSLYI